MDHERMNSILFLFILLLVTVGNPMPVVAARSMPFRHYSVTDGLPNTQVRQLIELPNGQIFVATEGFFSLFDGSAFVEQPCNLDSVYRLPAFGGHSYLWQGDSLLWLKDFYSLYLYHIREGRFRYDYQKFLQSGAVQHFIHERGDSLVKAKTEAIDSFRPRFTAIVQGTPFEKEWLQTYLFDRRQGTWMGLQNGGVLYVPPQRPMVCVVNPVKEDVVRQVAAIDAETLLLVGDRGAYAYDRRTCQVMKTFMTGELHGKEIARDDRGQLWVSTMCGLFRYVDGTWDSFSSALPHAHTRFALPLADGRLLVCTVIHELGYLHPESHTYESLNEQLKELADYRTIVAATRTAYPHIVLVCTQNGLFLLDTQKNTLRQVDALKAYSRYTSKFNCCMCDRKNRLWIGSQNGLICLQPTDSNEVSFTARRFDVTDGLSNSCIMSVVEDAQGCIWVGTAFGINRIELRDEDVNVFSIGSADGVPETELTEKGVCLTEDGMLLFTGSKGICTLQIDALCTEEPPLPVVIVGIKVRGRARKVSSPCLELSYHENYLEIDFSALNYAHPHQTRYRYKMEGLDDEWIYTSDNRGKATALYHALRPGTYRFVAESAIGTGVWGGAVEQHIVIHPPVWLCWWAKWCYFLSIVALVSYVIHLYLRKRKRKMESENDERVNQLFELRNEARHQFSQNVKIDPEKITVNKEEENLVDKLLKAIGEHLDDTDYTVERLAADVCMSRTSLYKKMQQILGITPNDFLRSVRLKRASQLLTETDLPVNRIAEMVGFQTPRYFRQCFKQMFGVNPSELRGNEG